MTGYQDLRDRFARIAALEEARAVLDWDAAAMMPPGGAAARGEQLAVLAGLAHGLTTAPEMAEALSTAKAPDDPWDQANLTLMRHAHRRATAYSSDLVEAQARANAACETVWREARARSDFGLVRPYFAAVVALAREAAEALGPALGLSPYDALMDGYQRGIGIEDVEPAFLSYEMILHEILPDIEARQARLPPPIPLPTPVAAARQEALCRELAERVGLDFAHARLDRSAHPFCGGTQTDIRITTRYDEANPATALLGVLHETGHALYERGLPQERARQPVGEAAGMAAHESQSLIMEMQACRSDAFLGWLGPRMRRAFGGAGEPYEVGNLVRLWRRVERGFIRTEADEVTYPAHIILRFRLERLLLSGELVVADLPGAWAEEFRRLLGVVPPDDRRGCLQDIHWYTGSFGYFPSYTLGAMAAAQLMAAARRDTPDIDAGLGRGDPAALVLWLRSRVHAQGSRLGFNDLLRSTTGSALQPSFFEEHLRRRYLG